MIKLKRKKKLKKQRRLSTAYNKLRRVGRKHINEMGYITRGLSRKGRFFWERQSWRADQSVKIHIYFKKQFKRWFAVNRQQRKQRRVKRAAYCKHLWLLSCRDLLHNSFKSVILSTIEGCSATFIHPYLYARHGYDCFLYWTNIRENFFTTFEHFFNLNMSFIFDIATLKPLHNEENPYQVQELISFFKNMLIYKPSSLEFSYKEIEESLNQFMLVEQESGHRLFTHIFWLSDDFDNNKILQIEEGINFFVFGSYVQH